MKSYLDRINYNGPVEPTPDVLRAVHEAHLLSVPFENLDIHWGRPIVLSWRRAVDKIVRQRRGGFCYELNASFAQLLHSLGFRPRLLAASVYGEDGEFGPNYAHMCLLVELHGRYLVDVGFGDSFIHPLRIDNSLEQVQRGVAYRIENDSNVLTLTRDGKPQYRFQNIQRELPDFRVMCHFQQTSPRSHFTRNTVCSRLTPTGRITLAGMKYIVTEGDTKTERDLSSQAEFDELLLSQFGITRPDNTVVEDDDGPDEFIEPVED